MRILAENTLLHLIDVQDKLTPLIPDNQSLVACIERLIIGIKALELPIVVSEQYPKGLGKTLPQLQTVVGDVPYFEKVTFSACDDASTLAHIQSLARKNIILCGIETHVCVMQTALDLLEKGYQPIVIRDAVNARFAIDHETGLNRLANAGAIITTSESILFELCRSSKAHAFKAISKLIKAN